MREAELGIDPQRERGGWGDFDDNEFGLLRSGGECEIDVREAMTPPEFLMQYLVPGRPVLLRGVVA